MSKPWTINASKIKKSPLRQPIIKMLDIELFVYEDTLLMGRILHQDESLRNTGTRKTIYSNNGFFIDSYNVPMMTTDGLYIRGVISQKDNLPLYQHFNTSEKLEEYVYKLEKALAEINKTETLSKDVSWMFKKVL